MQEARHPLLSDARELFRPRHSFSAYWSCQHTCLTSSQQLSSGYTVDPADGNRYVFTMNHERYPDFSGMIRHFHRAGIKVVPNIKACTWRTLLDAA